MSEELAVIRDVDIGCRDIGRPCLWFNAEGLHVSALQILNWEDAKILIEEKQCRSVKDLEGAAIIVECNNRTMVFKRLKK